MRCQSWTLGPWAPGTVPELKLTQGPPDQSSLVVCGGLRPRLAPDLTRSVQRLNFACLDRCCLKVFPTTQIEQGNATKETWKIHKCAAVSGFKVAIEKDNSTLRVVSDIHLCGKNKNSCQWLSADTRPCLHFSLL